MTEVARPDTWEEGETTLVRRKFSEGIDNIKLKAQERIQSLEELMRSLPEEYFRTSKWKATKSLTKSLVFCVVAVLSITYLPWYFLPIGWIVLGTAVTGLVTVAKDCDRNKFTNIKVLDYIIGTLCLVPLWLPFESWRKQKTQYFTSNHALAKSPFWWTSSTWQWISSNFIPSAEWFSTKFVFNAICIYTFVCLFFPLMAYNFGWWSLFKYYFIPFVIFHFWMSTQMKVDNSYSEDVTMKKWIRCNFPSWAEYLSLNLNYTSPELDFSIPSYNVREIYDTFQDKWEDTLIEVSFAQATLGNFVGEKVKQLKTEQNNFVTFLNEVNWTTSIFLFATPVIALYGLFTVEHHLNTWIVFFACWISGLLGITSGYHRLLSHRSYDASQWFLVTLTMLATQTFEASAFDWCLDHRAHHRYTDTDRDPYNIKRGFWYAHMGWLLKKRDKKRVKADISDLKRNSFLVWQHENYVPLALFTGIILPTLICGLGWGDWAGGFYIAAIACRVAMLQCTFCINSVAHSLGEFTYDDKRTPKDSAITSLLTFGEGYHNFHHEFPYDFRNGVHWYDYDPGKWVIGLGEKLGYAFNLKRMPDELIEKGKIFMKQKALDKRRANLNWGPCPSVLPEISLEELQAKAAQAGVVADVLQSDEEIEAKSQAIPISSSSSSSSSGCCLTPSQLSNFVIFEGCVYDVTDFLDKHPGGRGVLQSYLGMDITKAFQGTIYDHSLAARHLLDTLKIAKLKQ